MGYRNSLYNPSTMDHFCNILVWSSTPKCLTQDFTCWLSLQEDTSKDQVNLGKSHRVPVTDPVL